MVLKKLGRLEEALNEFSTAAALGHQPAIPQQRLCQQLIAARQRLSAVLDGKDRPTDALELLALAILCQGADQRRNGAAADFYAQAFTASPRLADDLNTNNRYNAACSAVLAGFGQGVDAAALDDATRARLRRQALEWLNADLVLWSKKLLSWFPANRTQALEMLRQWRFDSDLFSVRYAGSLATIPAGEREAWVRLWGEVEAQLKKASKPAATGK
jgi:hypothetical protein